MRTRRSILLPTVTDNLAKLGRMIESLGSPISQYVFENVRISVSKFWHGIKSLVKSRIDSLVVFVNVRSQIRRGAELELF